MRVSTLTASLIAGIVALAALPPVAMAQTPAEGQWVPLFDGKSLSGWDAPLDNASDWSVVDSILEGRGGGGGANYAVLVSNQQYSNFKLRIKYRYPESGGGGIELRRSGEGNITSCYWMANSVLPYRVARGRAPGNLIKVRDWRYHSPGPPVRRSAQFTTRTGQWYTLEAVCKDNRITTFLNGKQMDELTDKKLFASGSIALTVFGDSVAQFKDISIQQLPD